MQRSSLREACFDPLQFVGVLVLSLPSAALFKQVDKSQSA